MAQFTGSRRSMKLSVLFITVFIGATQIEAQGGGNTGSASGNPLGLPSHILQDPFYSPYTAPSPYGYPYQNAGYNQPPPQYANTAPYHQNPPPNYNYQYRYDPNYSYYGNQYQYHQPQPAITTPAPTTTPPPPPPEVPEEPEDVVPTQSKGTIGPDGPVFNPRLLPPVPDLGGGLYGYTGDVGTSGDAWGSGKVYSLPTGARSLLERVTLARLHRQRQQQRQQRRHYQQYYYNRHNYGANDPMFWLALGGF